MTRHYIASLLAILLFWAGPQCLAYDIQNDLNRLDAALAAADAQVRGKEQVLVSLGNMLDFPNTSPSQKLSIYKEIFNQCYPYSFDKSLEALNEAEKIASDLGASAITDVRLDKALLFATAGLYMESRELLNQLDTNRMNKEQVKAYHYVMQRFWKDYSDYLDANRLFTTQVSPKYRHYRNEYIRETPDDDFWHRMLSVHNLAEDGSLMEADAFCLRLIKDLDPRTHEYAIATYWYAVICEWLGRHEDKMHWFIESAIADIGNAVKDNASISSIANLLLYDDVDRASRYIQISLEDAMAYNAKLRPWQIAKLVPAIEHGYKQAQAENEAKVRKYVWIISALAIVLLFVALFLFLALNRSRVRTRLLQEQSLKLKQDEDELAVANEKLKDAIKQLSDANRAKREYIAIFLTMCSGYIDKLKKYITMDEKEAELRNFYNAFDNAFLQIYPDFVDQFNELLRPEERIVLKKDERMNTELRIFALIRLGITQSSHIASLLRYSVNTIYNYRAQVKNSALNPAEDFEKAVRNIENHEI